MSKLVGNKVGAEVCQVLGLPSYNRKGESVKSSG